MVLMGKNYFAVFEIFIATTMFLRSEVLERREAEEEERKKLVAEAEVRSPTTN